MAVSPIVNGEFTLSGVPAKGTLVISFIGYQTQEIQVNNQQKLSINLKEDSQQLQEVVVVAVELRRCPPQRPDSSIAKADIKELVKTPVNNVAESLEDVLQVCRFHRRTADWVTTSTS